VRPDEQRDHDKQRTTGDKDVAAMVPV
jgi:hypothetical protein